MDIHHAARAVGSDNDEPIVLIGFVDCVRGLADRRAQNRRAVLVTDEVGLLVGSTFVHPLKPIVDGEDHPVPWPPDC